MPPPPPSPSKMSNGDTSTTPSAVSSDVRKKAPSKAPATNPKMEEFLKVWRQDALNKHQYDSAIFIGDKLLALTGMFGVSSCFVRRPETLSVVLMLA